MVAEGETVKSWGQAGSEARPDLFLLSNMYLHLTVFRVVEFWTSQLVIAFKSHWSSSEQMGLYTRMSSA